MNRTRASLLSLLICALLGGNPLATASAADLASTVYSPTMLKWRADIAYDDVTLRVTGPQGYLYEQDFGTGQPYFSLPARDGDSLANGKYKFELVFTPRGTASLDNANRNSGTVGVSSASATNATYSGVFTVLQGQILSPQVSETSDLSMLDIVHNDDVIIDGSLCVGFDCVANMAFGSDTIVLKENNLRIFFDDTSNSSSFPNHDWRITINDSANGGQEKFSIDDVTAGRTPFTIEGNAPSNSLYVDSTGRVGFRTTTPVLDLHVATGNTPGLRLEQNGTSGFAPQSWDVAGNEASFFVRDVTGGSKLSFRIRPGAPTSSIDIAANGNVGIGTASPASPMHIKRTNGTAQLKIEDTNAGSTGLNQITMFNTGETRIRMDNGTLAWHLASTPNYFKIYAPPNNNQFQLDAAGNLTIPGTLTSASSRTVKENIIPTNGGALLSAVASLPLYTWNYKTTSAAQRHIGPIAEDFYDMFRFGQDDKHVAPSDVAGVALGAVKALNQVVAEKDVEIQALKERLLRLESLIGLNLSTGK